MKIRLPLTLVLLSAGLTATLSAQAPKTDKEKLGYSLGVDVAQTFKSQPFEFDQAQFMSGLRDVFSGGKTQLTDEQVKEVLTNFSNDLQAKKQAQLAQQAAGAKAASEKNRAAGTAYLAANKSKPGVQTLPDGLQYKVLQEGTGPMPKDTDTVTVKYRGTTIDGKEFDASNKHGGDGTATFPVNGVIAGWTEALQKMKVGSKWQLAIPTDLAYGERSPSPDIAPGSTLLFDVELVKIGGGTPAGN